jgi:indolepyruvate ferredoxin oxidoreductase
VRQALDDLGIDEARRARHRPARLQGRHAWPLEREGIRRFAEGLEEILVVEEKRAAHREPAQGAALQLARGRAPRVVGKFDEWPARWMAAAVDRRADPGDRRARDRRAHRRFHDSERHRERLRGSTDQGTRRRVRRSPRWQRTPYFCSGCPHNTSTRVPEGSRALAGIGCHYMAQWMDRNTAHLHPDGRRGRDLVGQAPFSETRSTSSPTSATAPISIPACWRSAPPSPPASTSPTRSSTTTRSR